MEGVGFVEMQRWMGVEIEEEPNGGDKIKEIRMKERVKKRKNYVYEVSEDEEFILENESKDESAEYSELHNDQF